MCSSFLLFQVGVHISHIVAHHFSLIILLVRVTHVANTHFPFLVTDSCTLTERAGHFDIIVCLGLHAGHSRVYQDR